MKVIRAIDDYFLGSNEGTIEDRIYLYATYATFGIIAAFTLLNL